MREKHKKTCKCLNYVEHLLISTSTGTGCDSISVFASLVCVPVAITTSAVGLKICAIAAGIKKYKSVIKKKKKMHHEIVLLRKTKLDTIKVLVSKSLIDPCISHDEFVSVNNVLREYKEMEEEEKSLKLLWNILYKNNRNLLRQL